MWPPAQLALRPGHNYCGYVAVLVPQSKNHFRGTPFLAWATSWGRVGAALKGPATAGRLGRGRADPQGNTGVGLTVFARLIESDISGAHQNWAS